MTEVLTYEALKAERDALEIRLRNALISEQEAIQRTHAANQTTDDLAVENQALADALSLISSCYGMSPHIQSMCVVETPATDAALAAIEARGVEKFADMCREKSKLATTADSCAGWKNCSVHASSFAIRLREAK
ncbi:TPA: hypothetical protein ACXM6M_000655 [Serratia marcescens]